MIQTEKKAPTMLLILDGFGYRREKDGNAIANAKMPTWHSLVQRYPHTLLMASGRAVGLPDGYMGNSEVGHLCMGAGRIVPTILSRFNDAIDDGSFFSNKIILEKLTQLKNENKPLHLIGLLSDAGVHSHTKHLFVIIEIAKKVGLKSIFIHVILDGRDTPPKSAKKYLQELENYCEEQKVGKIASIHGRFYAMDRDENWKRTEKSYNVLTGDKPGSGKPGSDVTWQEVLDQSYRQEITDEFVEPVLLDGGKTIRQDDGVFFFNFRSDRARQLTQCFINSARAKFP
ncbi:phosphoglycerate mutase (2,3-diphosphoglycerate-independent), partial [Candidatus Babeliales bacterium]|nr:phosphoglycerate mutase (2,3-diphosphoglycerate-independent) [Candidatus Babeliales bacterium]